MGKSDEAFSVSLNAKDHLFSNDSLLIDDLTLSTLQIVFQRLDRCKSLSLSLVKLYIFSSDEIHYF
jgi:hypothetical protein